MKRIVNKTVTDENGVITRAQVLEDIPADEVAQIQAEQEARANRPPSTDEIIDAVGQQFMALPDNLAAKYDTLISNSETFIRRGNWAGVKRQLAAATALVDMNDPADAAFFSFVTQTIGPLLPSQEE